MRTVPGNKDYTYGDRFRKLEPYMLYGDRNAANNPREKEEVIAADLEYLQGMYPGHIKRLQEYVISACDHLDYKNSPMYDEFPDRVLINQVCDSICRQIHEDGLLTDETVTEAESMIQAAMEKRPSPDDWELDEADAEAKAENDILSQQQSSSYRPSQNRPPQNRPPHGGPPPGPRPPHGGPPPWGPPPGPRPPHGGPPPWGPPPGPRPPHGGPPPWGPPPGPRPPHGGPPPWGPPPGHRPPPNDNWLNGIISVLLLNEMHRRRCRSGRCR